MASGPACNTWASTAGTKKVRLAPFKIAPAKEAPSGSRVITLGTPSWMPNCTYEVPPTWKSGIATMFLSPGSNSQPSWALSVCAIRARWVIITPLGRPVVPDEYITSTTSSGVTAGSRSICSACPKACSYSSPSAPSGVTSQMVCTPGNWSLI